MNIAERVITDEERMANARLVEDCNRFVLSLRKYLMDRFSYSPAYIDRCTYRNGTTVCASTAKYDLYFRVKPAHKWPENTLVVARIGFTAPRKGHGRDLIRFLIDTAAHIGYSHLGIECANDQSSAFALRYGLQPIKTGSDNWIGQVGAVAAVMATSPTLHYHPA